MQVSENGVLDWLLSRTFGGFTNWDSVYFLKIAEEGYLYEQYMAFFPLYPMMIRLISDALIRIPIFGENQRTLLLLCGWIISNSSFVASAVALYKLSIVILRKKNLAFVVSVLFCFNPATVFMASLYTESTFACLEFSALYFMETDGAGSLFLASVLFGLGSATRSNGILACGFISHAILRALFADLNSKRNHTSTQNISETVCLLATTLLKLLIFNTTVLAPSIGYQMYGYFAYCSQSLGRVHSSTQVSPWCKNTIPLSYTFIQKHYWDVGFLKYFEVKQIPNFLLASPMVVLCFSAVMSYFDKKENFAALKTLGLKLNINKKEEELKKHCEKVSAYHNPRLFVYIVHLGFVTVLGVTSMHVQVSRLHIYILL